MGRPKGSGKKSEEADVEAIEKPKKVKVDKKPNSDSRASLALKKKFGEGIIVSGGELIENELSVVSVSPAIDSGLSGGIKKGTICVLSGPPRCGKSSLAFHIGKKCQQDGMKFVYLNAEARLAKRDLEGFPGLDIDAIDIIQHSEDKILTATDFYNVAEEYLLNEKNCYVVIDSVSILVEEKEWAEGLNTFTRGGAARLLAAFSRRMSPVIPVNGHILMMITHVYANTSGYGKTTLVKMGSALDYSLSTFLQSKKVEPLKETDEKDSRNIGQICHWEVHRTPLGPGGKIIESYLRYGEGIDEVTELLIIAQDLSLVSKGGSWYSYGDIKVQGLNNLRDYFVENSEVFEKLKLEVKNMLE